MSESGEGSVRAAQAASAAAAEPSGWRWFPLTGVVIVLDQVAKAWIVQHLDLYQRIQVLPVLDITLLYNTGAAFSFLSEASGWQRWMFILLALAVGGAIVTWLRRLKARTQARSKSKIMSMRRSPDEEFGHKVTKVSVRQDCFEGGIEAIPWEQRKPYDEFDYGYVLTVHKSQGSQWDDVVLFDESFAFQDSRARWLYTGITRAAKRLSVVV